jgi:hypothetical protein
MLFVVMGGSLFVGACLVRAFEAHPLDSECSGKGRGQATPPRFAIGTILRSPPPVFGQDALNKALK